MDNSTSRTAILCFIILFFSCRNNDQKINYLNYDDLADGKELVSQSKDTSARDSVPEIAKAKSKLAIESDSLLKHPIGEPNPNSHPYYHLSSDVLDNNIYYKDTVIVRTTEELIKQIKSNRLIRLIDKEYILRSSNLDEQGGLLIDRIKNLKIVGTGSSKLVTYERNANVLKFSNTHNIHLDNLIIGYPKDPEFEAEQGVLIIDYSYNINISNCKLFGSGTFGLVTYAVYNLQFTNSEITECTALIFDLQRSRKFKFQDSKFHDNNLVISVLGGFSNASKDITFLNCDFLDNKPKIAGNPAFNQRDNYEPISFTNCTFRNNKGFKWYGEKINLNNCKIDSSGFIGL